MRWVGNGRQANDIVVIINQAYGLKLWYGVPPPGDVDWSHVSMDQCGIAFHCLYSQACLSLKKSQSPSEQRFPPQRPVQQYKGEGMSPHSLDLYCVSRDGLVGLDD